MFFCFEFSNILFHGKFLDILMLWAQINQRNKGTANTSNLDINNNVIYSNQALKPILLQEMGLQLLLKCIY